VSKKLPKTVLVILDDASDGDGDGQYLLSFFNTPDDIEAIDDGQTVGVYELVETKVKRESHELVKGRRK